ncbi:MAG: Asp-tRNA(Asn)/Glu-tRNA(Gln) amidotransferase subunit GatB [Cyclobacteriaceae bacterium]|nr:Asp-tRNA(Asn)/Glu-tRNA(Gln) amidotransferase subunit GatB [Cyclobacteriaceae bacterium]
MKEEIRQKYRVVIGLEVHAQLLTSSKIFSAEPSSFGAAPNTQVGVITLAHPGTLPKLNRRAFELAIKMGLACGSEISRNNIFDRKNYFYPDLPKGYQITQDRTPVCRGGSVTIKTKDGVRDVKLNRIHLEEDAGKSIHTEGPDTFIDLNRAGVALIEIVTEPNMSTAEEAAAFVTEVRKLVRYLDICDGNMEEGSLRCDANVSIMLKDATVFGKKVEIKNMNSIRNVQRAINVEIERQMELAEKGEVIASETRTYDADKNKTFGMREKEELNDYRYFPDPDLSPVVVSDEWLNQIKATMPALPHELFNKFVSQYKLSEYDATVLTDSKDIALYMDALCGHTKNYKAAANWMMGPVKSWLNESQKNADQFPVIPKNLADVIELIDSGTLNFTGASQRLFPEMLQHPEVPVRNLVDQLGLAQESNQNSILPIIEEVIAAFPEEVKQFKKGKGALIGMFMGEVMKRSQGKADPKTTKDLLLNTLKEV